MPKTLLGITVIALTLVALVAITGSTVRSSGATGLQHNAGGGSADASAGPVGPAGRLDWLKSALVNEPFFTSTLATALRLI